VQRIISRRLETGYSSRRELDLRTHLEQLKVLFEQISRNDTRFSGPLGDSISRVARKYLQAYTASVPNPNYPQEDYETFVVRAIARKNRRIERELDIEDITAPS
jgi:hypothetical protein